MTLSIKICGLSTEPTLDAALAAGADMIGLVFHAASPRFIAPGRAADLAWRARGRAEIVALTADADDRTIDEIMRTVEPDWLQLHGSESPERTSAIAARTGILIMKAVGIAGPADLAAADAYRDVADMLLFDAKPPKDADRPGGHGRPFDWAIVEGAASDPPFMLSGGLNPGNVADAIAATGATAVDVSSGVETSPGEKDVKLIRAFVAAARAAAPAPAEMSS